MKELEADLARRVLEHVRRSNYRPVKPRVIAKQLDLSDREKDSLRLVIKKLVQQGDLHYGSKHLVQTAAGAARSPAGPSMVEGIFRRTMGGFGFVRPVGTSPAAGRTLDIYVPRRKTSDAASGDTVLVRVMPSKRHDEKTQGEIVEIVARDTHRFVGSYFEREGVGYVAIDGGVFTQPILVGDPGAKNAKLADKVVVELIRFPSHVEGGEGVIVEVLGARGSPGVDTLGIIREYGLPDEFPDDVIEASRVEAENWSDVIPVGRTDLTGQTIITIDPKDARDFDDAISLERLPNGHWRLGVHIADVSHFVRPDTSLDREARSRGTSVYLPDRVLPMLPEIISNNLASLQPDRVRYTKTAFLEFTAEGVRVDVELHSAAIRSCRRFTYEEVDAYLADRPSWQSLLSPQVHRLLGEMHELAMVLRRRRLDQGAIELTLPEVKIDLDDEGRVAGAHLTKNTESHQIIEEFMLAANIAVAETLRDKELGFLRRIHESPDPRKLQTLTEFVRDLGLEVESMQSRFEIKRVIEQVRDRPEQHAVNYAVLRSMQKAVYSPMEEGHYALASDCYCHFTSPIRRYPDLTIHRLVESLVRGRSVGSDMNELAVLGQHCSEREQRAADAERELKKIKLLSHLSRNLGMELEAVVTGVEDFGLFCQGVELPADGLVHVDSLADDYYDFDPNTHSLTARRSGRRFRLGDRVRVRVRHVDLDRRELDFHLAEAGQAEPPSESPRKFPLRDKGTRTSMHGVGGRGRGEAASDTDSGQGDSGRPRTGSAGKRGAVGKGGRGGSGGGGFRGGKGAPKIRHNKSARTGRGKGPAKGKRRK